MSKKPDILTSPVIAETIQKIGKTLLLGHDLVVYEFPDTLPENVSQLVFRSEIRKELFGKYWQRYKMVNLNVLLLENPHEKKLEEEMLVQLKLGTTDAEIETQVLEKGDELVVVLDDLEKSRDISVVLRLIQRLKRRYNNKILFIFYLKTLPLNGVMGDSELQNIADTNPLVCVPFVDDIGISYYSALCVKRYAGLIKEDPYITAGYDNAIPHFGLHDARFKTEMTEEVNPPSEDAYSRSLLSRLSKEEREFLDKYVNSETQWEEDSFIYNVYKDIGVVDHLLQVHCKFRDLIKSRDFDKKLDRETSGKVAIPSQLEAILTRSETKILYALANQQGVMSREELAYIMWGEWMFEKYSVWAMDKRISRIRAKLARAGFDPGLLKTIHTRGYTLFVK